MEHMHILTNLMSAMVLKEPFETTSFNALGERIEQTYIDHHFDFVRRHQWDIGGTFRNMFRENEEDSRIRFEVKMKTRECSLLYDTDHKVIEKNIRSIYFLEPGYFGWGFTPKIASDYEVEQQKTGEDHKIRLNYNCFGNAAYIGAICRKRGLVTRFGMTPDHPFIIVDLPDGPYLYDMSRPRKMYGTFEERNGYSVYIPDRKDKLAQKLILVHDFRRALIYEILENVEALRRTLAASDDKVQLLLGELKHGLQLAEEYRSVVTKTSWSQLQHKLFPEISRSFYENKDAWEKEMVTINSQRVLQYPMRTVRDALTIALLGRSSLHIWGPDISLLPAIKTFKNKIRKHRRSVGSHLLFGHSLPRGMPHVVRKQIYLLRQHIENTAEHDTMPKVLREAHNVLRVRKLSPFQKYKKKKHEKSIRKNY